MSKKLKSLLLELREIKTMEKFWIIMQEIVREWWLDSVALQKNKYIWEWEIIIMYNPR